MGAALLAVTASIHLYLYLDGYRTIPVIGWLFLLQVVTGFALAAAVVATARRPAADRVAAGLGAGFAVTTLGGYLVSIWFGLFGFEEVFTIAGVVAGMVEVAGFALLGSLALLPASPAGPDGSGGSDGPGGSDSEPGRRLSQPGSRFPAGRAATAFGPRLRLRVLGAASLVALALLTGALASAGTTTTRGPAGEVALRTRRIAGTLVLTNARGYTLYWFALDTPRASHCYGTCAAYWPPVIGRPRGAPGLPGTLGTIERRGGSLQATYDHHPLYSYIGDSAPGQANGNGIFLDGGLWHEVRVRPG